MNGLEDQALLDRLVDGELSDAEYRQVLRDLESQPDGWRRCALAFLEAQAWRKDLGSLCETEAAPPDKPSPPVTPRRSWLYLGASVLACAASFWLAFMLAMRFERPAENPAPNLVANSSSTNGAGASQDSHEVGGDPLGPVSPELPVGKYRLVVNGGTGGVQMVEMPVFAADDPRAGMLLDEYATMPRKLIQELERSGHQVSRERNWVPMPGQSGPVYVPVDELKVTPVSSRSFQ